MKKLYIILIAAFFFQLNSFSQSSFTNGNVYDFEVGDIFQYGTDASEATPYGRQEIVIGKYYSEGMETVFYVFDNATYSSCVDWTLDPPLIYSFNEYQDTIAYSNLNELLGHPNSGQESNVSYYVDLCEDSIIHFHYVNQPDFEPEIYNYKYGIGLGRVEYEHTYFSEFLYDNLRLKYYSKGEDTCGTYDNTYNTIDVGIDEVNQQSQFSIFPNPVANTLNINGVEANTKLEILNLQGQIIEQQIIKSDQSIDMQSYASGVYLVKINHQVIKFIKE